jgi:four helix bundle protein
MTREAERSEAGGDAMAGTGFENLKVYRLAEELADLVWNIVGKWSNFARDTVGKQIVRSADSVGANIAEGIGRGSYQQNRHFIKIARGSLYETRHWLRRAYRRRLLSAEEINKTKPIIENLCPMLNSYLKSIGKATNKRPVPDD